MKKTLLTLEPMDPKDKKMIQTWFYNPVISFLAFPGISELKIQAYIESYLKEENTLLIKYENIIVGVIVIEFNQHIRIRSVFVEQGHRGKKIAKHALIKLIEHFPDTTFYAFIHDQQREHKNLFERCGFTLSNETKEFDFEGKKQMFLKYLR